MVVGSGANRLLLEIETAEGAQDTLSLWAGISCPWRNTPTTAWSPRLVWLPFNINVEVDLGPCEIVGYVLATGVVSYPTHRRQNTNGLSTHRNPVFRRTFSGYLGYQKGFLAGLTGETG